MKALMKGNAKAYFNKKQKPKQDPEEIMNKIEAGVIARHIGISDHEVKEDYASYFQLIQKIKLPKGFKRYLNNEKTNVIYYNEIEDKQYETHPNIDSFKVAFYQIIRNDKAVHTFDTKARKLLPFVQQKLIRQCIGLASKRRDAEKNNLQKDQNGKTVISKLARLKPNVKGLISSRSYMLKNLVQKIYTKKQIWGKGKRANCYNQVLAQYNKDKPQLDIEQQFKQTEYSLQTYQKIFTESKQYYYNKFGILNHIPKQLMKTKSFIKSTPDSVYRNLNFLNIDKQSVQLYWLARLMQCLPLPQNWTRKLGKSFDQFLYEPQKILFQLHPSYIYIIEIMNRFKGLFDQMDAVQQNYYTSMRQMIFFDYFERSYYVDWFAYIQRENQGTLTRKKVSKKSYQLKNNDWMALQALISSGMIQRQYPLLENLMNFWGELNYQQETYLPAISPFGQIIWSSRLNQKTIHFCPYSQKLQNILNDCRRKLPEIDRNDDLKSYDFQSQELKMLQHQIIFKAIPEQRQNFLDYYLKNDPKPLSQPYNFPQHFQKQNFYDIIFTSQFDLLSQIPYDKNELNEPIIPLWVQKCQAKLKSTKLYTILSSFPDKYMNIKRIISKEAIEQAKVHQPGKQEQLYRMLQEEVNNVKQLKKFVKFVNDIDAREQRKKLVRMGMNQEEQADLLGSSLSQIDVQDLAQDQQSNQESQQSQQEFLSQPDISQSSSQEEKQPLQQKQQSQQPSISEQSIIKAPQNYEGIVYSKVSELSQMEQQDIDDLLLKMKKQKTLKHKYSSQNIRSRIDSIDLAGKTDSNLNIKKNLLASQLHSYHTPYHTSPSKVNIIKRKNNEEARKAQTPNAAPDITEQFSIFQSQTSDYAPFNNQMDQYIQQYKKNRPVTPLSQSSQSNQTQYKPKVRNDDDTRQTIPLEPIMRIKPDIDKDSKLEHVSNFYEAHQFKNCFSNSPIKGDKKKRIFATPSPLKWSNSDLRTAAQTQKHQKHHEIIQNKLKLSQSKLLSEDRKKYPVNNPQLLSKDEFTILKSQSVVNISELNKNISSQNKSLFGLSANKSYKRICLGSTAKNLLQAEPITRRGDLIVLEAQKELMHKGRGLQTKIHKHY